MRAVIGLGGNVGDRLANLRAARDAIGALGVIVDTSNVWETPPVGPPQPDYFNAAVALDTALGPRELLVALLDIERSMGRVREVRWGPRTIDLDILWVEGAAVDEPGLQVPHPRLRERDFALVPLLEVAPDARDPTTGERYVALGNEVMRRVGSLA